MGEHPFAARPVAVVSGVLLVVLVATSQGYGWHRDELYFRMLPPDWGYTDQPPLVPFLARTLAGLVDQPWAVRLPAAACAAASVVVAALLAREVGGDRRAQLLAAVAVAGSTVTLLFGHVLLTSSLDLVVWPLVCLLVLRAVVREQPRWWVWTGVVVGLSTWNKLLMAMLLVSLAVGLLVTGRGRALLSRGVAAGGAAGAVLALPNLLYQATHGWPQLATGAALGASNGDEVRVTTWVFLVIATGPPLVAFWVAGCAALLRRPGWAGGRFLAAALPVLVLLTLLAGSQPYYPSGLLVVLVAVGAVPVTAWARSRPRRALVLGAVALNTAVSAVVALPLVPLGLLGSTPVPAMNQVAADQVGWPRYVEQVAAAWDALPDDERSRAAVVTANYGEAGAIARFGPALGLPAPSSGHNALADLGPPPEGTDVVVLVGTERVRELFASCEVVDHLDDGLGVDNEEQGVPVAVCRDPSVPWERLWEQVRHLD
ncbi:glycosyltransferase family 39 protein [Angustibacter speluncae]